MRILIFLILILSPFSLLYGSQTNLIWETDFVNAAEKSAEDKKPLLLFFSGSDWSGLSMKMKNEVLDSEAFQNKIASSFHCVLVDFPKHSELSPGQIKQNLLLKECFHVQEYPLLVLLDSDHREIYRIGYFPETGEQFGEELLHIIDQDAQLCAGLKELPKDEDKLLQLYQIAGALTRKEAQEKVLSAGLELDAPYFLLEKFRLCSQEGKDVSSLREKLLKSDDYQIHFTVALIDFQERASKMRDPKEVIKPLESYLERFADKDQQNVWRIEMMIAQFYLDSDDWSTALEHAQTAYNAAPSGVRDEIENSLMYIRDQIR